MNIHAKSAQIVSQSPQKNCTRSLPTSFRTIVRRYSVLEGHFLTTRFRHGVKESTLTIDLGCSGGSFFDHKISTWGQRIGFNQYKGNWGHSPWIFQLLILRPNMLSEKKHDYSHTFSKSNLCQHSMAILKKKIAYFWLYWGKFYRLATIRFSQAVFEPNIWLSSFIRKRDFFLNCLVYRVTPPTLEFVLTQPNSCLF